jgi:hypothetical protein
MLSALPVIRHPDTLTALDLQPDCRQPSLWPDAAMRTGHFQGLLGFHP